MTTEVLAYKAYYQSKDEKIGKEVIFLFDHRSKQSLLKLAKELLYQANLEIILQVLAAPEVRVCLQETDFGDADDNQLSLFEGI